MIAAFTYGGGGNTQAFLAAPCQSEALGDAGEIMPFIPEAHGFWSSYLSDGGFWCAVDVLNYFAKPLDFVRCGESNFEREAANVRAADYADSPIGLPGSGRRESVPFPLYIKGIEILTTEIHQSLVGVANGQAVVGMQFTSPGTHSMRGFTQMDSSLSIEEAAQPPSHEVLSGHALDFNTITTNCGGL